MGAIGKCPICHPEKPAIKYKVREYCLVHGNKKYEPVTIVYNIKKKNSLKRKTLSK